MPAPARRLIDVWLSQPRVVSDELEINREVSWLDFNARVLALAADPNRPLLERARFLAIFSANLDEFFQVRVSGLKDLVAAGVATTGGDDRKSPVELLREIRERVTELTAIQDTLFVDEIAPALAEAGIGFSHWAELDDDDRRYLVGVFDERIYPVLTPLAVDPSHPFPYISNLSLNLAVQVREPGRDVRRFARVKVPPLLPRFVVLPDGERVVSLEQVIAAHLGSLFTGMHIESHHAFRVVRNADLTLEEEEADDLVSAVELELRRRRFGRAVRLEVAADANDEVVSFLRDELDLDDADIYRYQAPLDLGGLTILWSLDRADLKDPGWVPVTEPRLQPAEDAPVDLFAELRRAPLLVHHPYSSFSSSVEAFIGQAADDPDVLAIKQTLYRTSGDSPIVKSLIRAAERGKQVAVIVEVKARFDEQANIAWARQLEEAGVHVVYGLVGLKTHSKTALVVREELDGIRRYCHVGTGNYNPTTARLYEDLGLLTADPDVGDDLTQLFNLLTGFGLPPTYRRVLTAPHGLRRALVDMIRTEAEAGPDGRIVMKVNALVDREMVDELTAASRSGVSIDLIVRGICSLRPDQPGLTETVRVRSIVGRFLEHSRIYHFAHGGPGGTAAWFISSADLMSRNLDRRVEVAMPITEPDLQERLAEIVEVELADDVLAWMLRADGSWCRVPNEKGINAQTRLEELAELRAGRKSSPG